MFLPEARILIIDDASSMRQFMRKLLDGLGFKNLLEVSNGAEGLRNIEGAMVDKKVFDLVLCDWSMPGKTGLDVLKAVRGGALTKNTPFIMVHGDADKKIIDSAVACGASSFFIKPLTGPNLKKKIEEAWAKHHKVAA